MLTEIHNVVSTDGTIVDNDIPGPERYGIPLQRTRVSNGASYRQAKKRLCTFFTSNRFFPPLLSASPAVAPFFFAMGAAAGASVMSTSAMVKILVEIWW